MDDRPPLQSNSGKDRRFSVGDFLLEVDEVLRPMIDLTDTLHEIRAENPNDPCIIPYRDRADAIRAQTRLRLLIRDPHYPDRGKNIGIGKTFNAENGELLHAIRVPHELFVRPRGADRAPESNITDRIDWFRERRDAIAVQVQNHKLAEASEARDVLWKDLCQRGIIVTIPETKLQRLLTLYEKLPGIDQLGGPAEQLQNLLPLVSSLVEESGKRRGTLGAKTLLEREFILQLSEISDEIFKQRHEIGRSHDSADSHHYFSDDFAALLRTGIERGLGVGVLDTPFDMLMAKQGFSSVSPFIHTGAPSTRAETKGHVISRLKKTSGRSLGDEGDQD